MGKPDDELVGNYSHLRVFAKAFATYVGFLTILTLAKDFSPFAEGIRQWFFSHSAFLPLGFVPVWAAFIFQEALLRSQVRETEAKRSNKVARRKGKRK